MPNGPRSLVDSASYHITVRGNNRQVIFRVSKDYQRYLEVIKRCKRKYGFGVFGYCARTLDGKDPILDELDIV